ncbi:MAG: ferredoxin [Lewinellaceae bacterium]|nr:ferredoxin [Lewinellaceae bacterium]
MNDKKPERELFQAFFTEDASPLFAATYPEEMPSPKEEAPSRLPVLPAAPPSTEQERSAFWRSLRLFLRSGKGGGIVDADEKPMAFPAALAPFRDQPFLDRNYPCWVGEGLEAALVPIQLLLQQTIQQFAPEAGQAQILKGNLVRLEQIIRDQCRVEKQAIPSHMIWESSLKALREKLDIEGPEGATFLADLLNFQKLLPKSGWVLPFNAQVPLFMLAALVHDHRSLHRRRIEGEVMHLSASLRNMLAIEEEKSPKAKSAEHLNDSMDFAGGFLDFQEMSNLMPESGSTQMPADRLQRLQKALDTLQQANALLFPHTAVFVMEKDLNTSLAFDWKSFLPDAKVRSFAKGKVAESALEIFDQTAQNAAEFFAALRIAQLEIDNQYKPELHDDFFEHFSWAYFSESELAACPPVVMCADSTALLEQEWTAFSNILSSNRPIKALVLKNAEESDLEGVAFRQEPGAMAIAHRDAFVLQSASLHPSTLYQGLKDGMSGAYPALFHILSPAVDYSMLGNSAAVEGREFPGFTYDCRKGPKWGSRFDVQNNPDTHADWATVSLDYQGEDGVEGKMEMPFTFADYAALNPAFSNYFQLVPPAFWTDDLVPIEKYIQLPEADRYSKVPVIWMVNTSNQLVKAAVAWPLVQVCQERLDFWHFLQENAGVHSFHVEMATDRLREELAADYEAEINALKAEHEKELEEARENAARDAMERLVAVLLDLDTSAVLSSPAKPAKAAPAPKAADEPAAGQEPAKEEAPPVKEAAPEILTLGEAWIESALCTSCNECINVNKQVFQYNANKQAFVANPKAGAFSEIVKAAENCPVAIIHPGAPQDPNEPGLEALVKRAEAFN